MGASLVCEPYCDILGANTSFNGRFPKRLEYVAPDAYVKKLAASKTLVLLMAQFTVGGRVKPSIRGDGLSIGFVQAFHRHINSRSGDLRRLTKRSAYKESDLKRKPCFFAGFKVHSLSARDSNCGVYGDIMEDDEDYMIDELSGFRGLVLDISYRPVNVVCWKRAICLEFMDKADVLEYYDQTVNSPTGSFYIPAVLRVPHLLQVIKRRKVKRGLSRKSIYHRDNFTCQYCSATENLTVDHVCPLSRGGKWTWENLVCACAKCNSKKGQKTLEEANMKLLKIPKAPKDYDVLSIPLTNQTIKMLRAKTGMPEEWRQYLSKPYGAP